MSRQKRGTNHLFWHWLPEAVLQNVCAILRDSYSARAFVSMCMATPRSPVDDLPRPSWPAYIYMACTASTLCSADVCACVAGAGQLAFSWAVGRCGTDGRNGAIRGPRKAEARINGSLSRLYSGIRVSCEILTDLGRSGRRPPHVLPGSGLQRTSQARSRISRHHA